MSPKTRFQILIEPEQLEALRAIQDRTGAPVAAQVRLALQAYLEQIEESQSRSSKRQKRR